MIINSQTGDEIKKKIYEIRSNNFDIFENKENYVIYKIENIRKSLTLMMMRLKRNFRVSFSKK